MNAESRTAAIEAGARALWAASLGRAGLDPGMLDRAWPTLASVSRDSLRQGAAAVIDAAAPHLAGEPVGYGTINERGELIADGLTLDQARSLCALRDRWAQGVKAGRVVALVPVEDQP